MKIVLKRRSNVEILYFTFPLHYLEMKIFRSQNCTIFFELCYRQVYVEKRTRKIDDFPSIVKLGAKNNNSSHDNIPSEISICFFVAKFGITPKINPLQNVFKLTVSADFGGLQGAGKMLEIKLD